MKLNLTRPLALFDLETTGVDVGKDRIVEISILKVNTDGSEEIFTSRINPTIPIPAFVTSIHGITNEDVKDCPTFEQIAKKIATFIGKADLAGYNSNKFDIPLLVEEFLRAGVSFDVKDRRFVDIQNIFHKMEPRTLRAAYKFYCNTEIENAHSAEADIKATYEVLKAQLDKYADTEIEDANGKNYKPVRNDIQALHDFSVNSKNVDLAGHIVYNDKKIEVFNFGKNKGRPVLEVFQKEPQYYDWMMKADFPLYTKEIITKIKIQGGNTAFKLNFD
jgi:DNA polymerase-3 subunit epsilon